MLIENPGLSIMGIDPGSTTGIAIYDAVTGKVYIDQLDCGGGQKVRLRTTPISPERKFAVRVLYGEEYWQRRGHGANGEMNVLAEVENVGCTVLLDLIMALGPRTVIVMEDFILGWGDASRAGSSGREGLSPVRIGTRLHSMCMNQGIFNGDAWREWDGFGAGGDDPTGMYVNWGRVRNRDGVSVVDVPDFKDRYMDVQHWRLGDERGLGGRSRDGGSGALWRGPGARFVWRLPGTRLFIGGNEKRTADWMRGTEHWWAGKPHAMDAMMHMLSFARKAGISIPGEMELIWHTSRKSGINEKKVRR